MFVRLTKWVFLAVLAVVATAFLIISAGARTPSQDDVAPTYKSKCFACHGATAEKKFDATKTDDELIQTVLKGKKMDKPPNMPGYEEKGITAEQAKGLVDYMKSLQKQ